MGGIPLTEAASAKSSPLRIQGGSTSFIRATLVRVPVLSNATVSVRDYRGRRLYQDLCRSRAIPPKYRVGMEMTKAQGQEMTRSTKAR